MLTLTIDAHFKVNAIGGSAVLFFKMAPAQALGSSLGELFDPPQQELVSGAKGLFTGSETMARGRLEVRGTAYTWIAVRVQRTGEPDGAVILFEEESSLA